MPAAHWSARCGTATLHRPCTLHLAVISCHCHRTGMRVHPGATHACTGTCACTNTCIHRVCMRASALVPPIWPSRCMCAGPLPRAKPRRHCPVSFPVCCHLRASSSQTNLLPLRVPVRPLEHARSAPSWLRASSVCEAGGRLYTAHMHPAIYVTPEGAPRGAPWHQTRMAAASQATRAGSRQQVQGRSLDHSPTAASRLG